MISDYPIIDLHAHLRDGVSYHTEIARNGGIDFVVAMPNTQPCLDNKTSINKYLKAESAIPFAAMSAITTGREGKRLVDVESIAPLVVGFTDDGNCLEDMGILKDILGKDVWVMLHCGKDPPHDVWPRYSDETIWVEKVLEKNRDANGKLYIQHVSRKESVDLIRQAKKDGVIVTAETCPHYFRWTGDTMRVPVNPPIGNRHDREAIREALSDGTIDIISSDYAPEPRPKVTGIADWDNYVSSCKALVDERIINGDRFLELVSKNPMSVLKSSSGYKAGNIRLRF